MEIAKVTSKGQITIPKAVRDKLELEAGSKVIFLQVGNDMVVRNAESISAADRTRSEELKTRFLAEAAARYDLDVEQILSESTSKSVSELLEDVRASFRETIEEKGLENDEEIAAYFGLKSDDLSE